MSINPERLSPIERELRFRKWCKDEHIKRFLIDLDDTICPTREIFRNKMSLAYDFLEVNAPIMSREEWEIEVVTTDNRLFEELGVNSNRWNKVVDELSEKYLLSEGVNQETKSIFQSIYTTPLTMFEGVDDGLIFFKKTDTPVGIVTHAGREWTWKKYNWLNLSRYLDWDEVFIVDENKHKTSESWQQAVNYFGLSVEDCAVVGDSPRSDINPAWEIGVKHCFLVEDPKQWSVHDQPVDQNVERVSNLVQIPDVVIREF